jgi:hypothetical protein
MLIILTHELLQDIKNLISTKKMDCRAYYDNFGAKPYYYFEKSRFEQTLPLLLPSGTLHDTGCGCCYWLDFLLENTDIVVSGSDVSPVRLEAGREYLSRKHDASAVYLKVADIMHLPFGDGEFDQVTALETLEHVPRWKDAFSEVVRIAKRRAIITVPYHERIVNKRCPKCGTETYLNGHLNSLRERDFSEVAAGRRISFGKIYQPHDFRYYAAKVIKDAMVKIGVRQRDPNEYVNTFSAACPKCFEEVQFRKRSYPERALTRLVKTVVRYPLHLVVQIDKE